MKPHFHKAGNTAFPKIVIPTLRKSALPLLLLCTAALAGCATTHRPPEISYDDAAPATLRADPPAPVQVVELPKPLPLPGQMKPVEESRRSPESFRVAWTERRYQDGSLADTSRWTAILTVVVQPPRDTEKLRANPLGIYVNAINWSRELGQ